MIVFPKYRKGIVKKVVEKATYVFIFTTLFVTFFVMEQFISIFRLRQCTLCMSRELCQSRVTEEIHPIPVPLSSEYTHSNKSEAVMRHKSRFRHTRVHFDISEVIILVINI